MITPVFGNILKKKIPFFERKPSVCIFLQFLLSFFIFLAGFPIGYTGGNSSTTRNVPDTVAEIATENNTIEITTEETTTEDITEQTTENIIETETTEIEKNKLQIIFTMLTPETTIEDVKNFIDEFSLNYTMGEYSDSITYKIAYSEEAAKQKYAKEDKYLKIDFDNENEVFMYATYSNHDGNITLFYNYGTYYDLREKAPQNPYSGYYYYNLLDADNGITIKYSNGNSVKTKYHPCENAEDALNQKSSELLVQSIAEAVEQSFTEPPTELPTEPPTEIVQPEPVQSPEPEPAPEPVAPVTPIPAQSIYVLNLKTKKFHFASCPSAEEILPENREERTGNAQDIIAEGYDPCKRCNPY